MEFNSKCPESRMSNNNQIKSLKATPMTSRTAVTTKAFRSERPTTAASSIFKH